MNVDLRVSFHSLPATWFPFSFAWRKFLLPKYSMRIQIISVWNRVCTTENFLSPVFSPSLWSSKHVTSWVSGRVASLCLHALLKHFFCCFSSQILYFYHFLLFFDKVSNLHNRILKNQSESVNGDKKLSVELYTHVKTNHGN